MDRSSNEQVVMLILAIVLCVAALWAIGCGGGSSYSGTPTSPSTSTPAPTTPAPTTPAPTTPAPSTPAPTTQSVTVSIVSSSGSGAFNPNPVQATSGNVVWTNNTSVSHVLVMNDGRSIGTVAPGASVTMAAGAGGAYHCTTHPSMVGSINGAVTPTTPPSGTPDY
jgi:plastocyanin